MVPTLKSLTYVRDFLFFTNQKMKNKIYDFKSAQNQWSTNWEKEKIYKVDLKNAKKPFYNLMMFPYPSAAGLHAGHGFTFPGIDTYGRFMRMQGYDVFEPFGVDSFGIHGENYALKIGKHPKQVMRETTDYFYSQLKRLGNGYDWDHIVETHDPSYYKWTQWIFTQLFEKGLAVRKTAMVNWCPSCKTVLSDEQVIDQHCERCKNLVEKKEMKQWFFKITDYAQRLLDNLDKIDWIDEAKITQRNWIGRSSGAIIKFHEPKTNTKISVFTTRPDTLFGATYLVLAPENHLVSKLATPDKLVEVNEYVSQSIIKEDIDRLAEGKEKTGVFIGSYAINPINNEKIPIWISDYVLNTYGTGAIMAVPAHDQRDYDFAMKFNLEIKYVIEGSSDNDKANTQYGKLINSGPYSGQTTQEAKLNIVEKLKDSENAEFKVTFKLRDWCISRQRYWGPPIPMIHCNACEQNKLGINKDGWFSVPLKDLPVLLPETSDYIPDGSGKSPLARIQDFVNTKCPNCQGEATRETDVSDNFLDSSWYFLRYPSTDFNDIAFDKELTAKWFPVNQYTGGMEHAVLHLMYSRFITMALFDMGHLDFEEPFTKLNKHGIILKDGQKMSKSVGNVINPDEYIEKYGADSWRLYMFFIGPFNQGGNFSDTGIMAMNKFVNRLYAIYSQIPGNGEGVESLETMHRSIKKVGEDISSIISYNTAISSIMEYVNWLYKQKDKFNQLQKEIVLKNLALIIAPFAPFLAEQLWYELGQPFSIHKQSWPIYDKTIIDNTNIIIAIQVNGKLRSSIEINPDMPEDEIKSLAIKDEKVIKFINKDIKKIIYVKGKILNIVI